MIIACNHPPFWLTCLVAFICIFIAQIILNNINIEPTISEDSYYNITNGVISQTPPNPLLPFILIIVFIGLFLWLIYLLIKYKRGNK